MNTANFTSISNPLTATVAAMAAIGMKTQLRELATVGLRPVVLMVGETVFLAGLALAVAVVALLTAVRLMWNHEREGVAFFSTILVVAAVAVLLGAHNAFQHRIDGFEVRGVGGDGDPDFAAALGLPRGARALVVFDVPLVGGEVGEDGPLEAGEDALGRVADDVGEGAFLAGMDQGDGRGAPVDEVDLPPAPASWE